MRFGWEARQASDRLMQLAINLFCGTFFSIYEHFAGGYLNRHCLSV